ncbi:hypothetical protein POM88_049601 [Heracleum sosnowskyi]|uniref:Uncharacterized protein n=1 Tax=Heracleum sosnowskyi TaxID=360622 RepID=A0AAD8GVX5_9APIA|nr:hypothetical protein POM88_049601 [Heracleum sosnowskyi]
MPCAPRVCKMLSFSVMTPYYSEETVYSKSDLEMENEDGISINLQKLYPECELWDTEENIMQLRQWASLRGHTLCRTIRGMMYYRRALKFQAFHDMAKESVGYVGLLMLFPYNWCECFGIDSGVWTLRIWFLSSGSVWRATNEDLALMRTCVVMCGFILSRSLSVYYKRKRRLQENDMVVTAKLQLKYADPWKRGIVVLLLQDMFEEVTCDMMVNEICSLIKTYALDDFVFPPVVTAQWELGRTGHINTYIKPVQCSMFNLITIYDYLLLTVKESAVGVPTKLRARRRVTFFTNSLFMKITCAPRVRKMLVGFVYWTSAQSLIIKVSGLPTTVKRLSIRRVTLRWKMKMLRQWASLRGHTLCRTIRGMMYYRRALKFQAFHDMAKDSGNMNNFLDYFNIWKKEPTRGVQKWIAKHVINMLDPWKRGTVVLLLQDMFEVVTCDMMVNEIWSVYSLRCCELVEFKHSKKDSGRQLFDKTYALDDFVFPPVVTAQWEEQIRRLYLLLTVKESAVDVPINLEARRRVTFFTNSLFMKMPFPGRNHISGNCNVMTPYYSEETVYLKSDLVMENEDSYLNGFYRRQMTSKVQRNKGFGFI